MSRISFQVDGLTVVAGWDNPFKGYFLNVFDEKDEDEPTPWLAGSYESLDDPNTRIGFLRETGYFRAKLEELGIEAVPGFWELVERNEGNVCYTYRGGKWVQR